MDRPKWEVAEVFRRYGEAYRQAHGASLCPAQRRVMSALECCRTAALGGHLEQCDRCGHQRNAYNSCSDRHCPKCQSLARARWLEARQTELLDTEYFHVVFTLPDPIASIAYQNKRELYGLLFRTVAETLRTIAADPQHLGALDRLFRRAAYLGADPAVSSPPALCGDGGWSLSGWHPMGELPSRLLLAGAGALPPLSPAVPGSVGQRLRGGPPAVLGFT
jgi:hypothetical protein